MRSVRELGGLFTLEDLANWKVKIEEPVHTSYKGIEVYKLTTWVQGPVMLQALNILENFDLKPMGYNSARYIHTLYQAMNLAYADRDFYYGDPAYSPAPPIAGLLSKEYARERARLIRPDRNDPDIRPGDPYPYQSGKNPYLKYLEAWHSRMPAQPPITMSEFDRTFRLGTTSVEAVDEKGWAVSVTPSGGWVPAVIAGHTGIGLSQRMQSFVLDPHENPYNVLEPGKRPRATLTPSLALKDGKPFLVFSVQGGDTQDQNLLQFFLNVVEFGMTVQEATEAANITSYQMRDSFADHQSFPGRLTLKRCNPALGARGAHAHGLQARVRGAHLGPAQRDLHRSRPRDALGRLEQLRAGLRHRVVRDARRGARAWRRSRPLRPPSVRGQPDHR